VWVSRVGCPQAPIQCVNTWAWQSMIMLPPGGHRTPKTAALSQPPGSH
jgi:hypothetical protein